jgi:hypothetical protein
VGFSFNASLGPQRRARKRGRLAEAALAHHTLWDRASLNKDSSVSSADVPEHIDPDGVPHPGPLSTVNTADLEQGHVAYVRRSLNLLHLKPCGDAHFPAAYWSALHRNDALTTPCRTDAPEHTNPDDVPHPPSTVIYDCSRPTLPILLQQLPCGDVYTQLAVTVSVPVADF